MDLRYKSLKILSSSVSTSIIVLLEKLGLLGTLNVYMFTSFLSLSLTNEKIGPFHYNYKLHYKHGPWNMADFWLHYDDGRNTSDGSWRWTRASQHCFLLSLRSVFNIFVIWKLLSFQTELCLHGISYSTWFTYHKWFIIGHYVTAGSKQQVITTQYYNN